MSVQQTMAILAMEIQRRQIKLQNTKNIRDCVYVCVRAGGRGGCANITFFTW